MRSFRAASSTLSPSWMSMARLALPSRLEFNRPEASFNVAPLGNVILTTTLYASPVQTMPPWDQTRVPGFVGFTHFHSSTISGSASCMIPRTLASVFPRQSPSFLTFSFINVEADFTGTVFLICTSNTHTYFSCRQRSTTQNVGGARSGARWSRLQAAPEEVREPPEHAGGRCPAPRLRAITHRKVGDKRRGEVDGKTGEGPFLEPRRHRRKQQHHAKELGQRELHPEVVGEAE